MTFVLALYEVNFVTRWRCVCYHMPSNTEFAFLKKIYGFENLRFTSDSKIVSDIDSSDFYEDYYED